MPEVARVLALLNTVRGFIFDMDGTLVLGDKASGDHKALPGTAELLGALRERRIPYQVFTNGTARTPEWYAASLRHAGLDVRDGEMMTPSTAAAAYLKARGADRVLVLGREAVWRPLAQAGLTAIEAPGDGGRYDAVYVGWFKDFTYTDLEAAAEAIWGGAQLTTASNVRFFAAAGGRAIGSSFMINAMLSALTETEPLVLGKPSQDALKVALARMGLASPGEIAVVGDDADLEVFMANEAGALSVAVTSGFYKRAHFESQPPEKRAQIIVSGTDELLSVILGRAEGADRGSREA
jgi:HAD superfamily hydrolase (TIGR01450 family)